jgi:hypothetical protein
MLSDYALDHAKPAKGGVRQAGFSETRDDLVARKLKKETADKFCCGNASKAISLVQSTRAFCTIISPVHCTTMICIIIIIRCNDV